MSEWEVSNEWRIEPLKLICSLITDGAHFSPVPQVEGEAIANVKDMKGNRIDYDSCTRISKEAFEFLVSQNCSPRKGDVLLSKDGTIGRVVLFEDDRQIVLLSSIAIIRPKPEVDPHYLRYVLSSFSFEQQLYSLQSGSALKRITVRDINRLKISFPPVHQQRKIARILTTVDNLIEKTEALIAKYQAIKQGMMHDLFTRGVDEHGHLRPPYEEAPELYKQSELGWIPKEWEVKQLCDLGTIVTGNTPPTASVQSYDGPFMFVTPVDITDNITLISTTARTLSKGGLAFSRAIPANAICTVCIGSTIGKIARTSAFCATNQQINSLVLNDDRYSSLMFYLMCNYLPAQLRVEAGLQAVPIVNKRRFSELLVAAPTLIDEKTVISKHLSAIDRSIAQEQEAVVKYAACKTGLMQDLLTGKVRVKVDEAEEVARV